MKKIIILTALLVWFMGFTGCTALRQMTGAPVFPECNESISGDSVLKNIAVAHGLCLEDVGDILIIANTFAINKNLYTRVQATAVVHHWIVALNSEGMTYNLFRKKIYRYVKQYPGLFEIADIYLLHFGKISSPILPKDKELLNDWLTNRVLPLLASPEATEDVVTEPIPEVTEEVK
jgi:hypothetical protein